MTLGEKLTSESNGSLIIVSVAPEPLFQPNSHSKGGAFPHSPTRQLTQASPFIAYQENSSLPLCESSDIAPTSDFCADQLKKLSRGRGIERT